MTDATDTELLERYARKGDDDAFRALAQRHAPMVYAAALRQLADPSAAEEAVQAVFTQLARKAGSLGPKIILPAWLHRATRYECLHIRRGTTRRLAREREAAAMKAMDAEGAEPAWEDLRPVLDEALDALPRVDREALILRFFDGRSLREIGDSLALAEDTARKRVSRALDKLRAFLAERGITSTVGALSVLLAAPGIRAAPTGIGATVAGPALAEVLAKHGLIDAVLGLSRASRLRLASAAALLLVGAATPAILLASRARQLEQENIHLRSSSAALAPLNAALPPDALGAPLMPPQPSPLPPDIIAAAAKALTGGRLTISATTEALSHLARLPDAQLESALPLAEAVPDEKARKQIVKFLLGRWAEKEPEKAFRYALRGLAPGPSDAASRGVMTGWARHNPVAAQEWSTKTGKALAAPATGPVDASLVHELFRGVAAASLETAVAQTVYLPNDATRSQAMHAIGLCLSTEGDRQQFLAATERLPDASTRLMARRALTEHWAEKAPMEAAAWIDSLPDAFERSKLMDSLGLAWLQQAPSTAADWWIARAPGGNTLTKIMNVWSLADPDAAGAWLGQHGIGPEADTARMTFARIAADIDGESALTWAATLHDPLLRQNTEDYAASTWLAREPGAADTFLRKQPGWSRERIERLAPRADVPAASSTNDNQP